MFATKGNVQLVSNATYYYYIRVYGDRSNDRS
jgi:hypothetical protein